MHCRLPDILTRWSCFSRNWFGKLRIKIIQRYMSFYDVNFFRVYASFVKNWKKETEKLVKIEYTDCFLVRV